MKVSSSRMKNKVGAQKGAFIKMKQENMYVYQWLHVVCYVPIIPNPVSHNRTHSFFVLNLFRVNHLHHASHHQNFCQPEPSL